MKMRKLMYIFIGVKLGIISLCFFLLGTNYLLVGRIWFSPVATFEQVSLALKEKKTEVDLRDEEGFTGLMKAIGTGRLDWVKAFLDAGADINAHAFNDVGDTPLHIACYNMDFPDSLKILDVLLKKGAKVNAYNKREEMPIHVAAQVGNVDRRMDVIMILVKHGANINAQDRGGRTIAHIAASNNDIYFMRALLSLGSMFDYSIKNKKGAIPALYTQKPGSRLESGVIYSADSGTGDTPREYAEKLGFRDVAAVVPTTSSAIMYGLTPLMRAVIAGKQDEVETILRSKSDINAQSQDQYKQTALHFALICNRIPLVAFLLKSGARTDILNGDGQKAIHTIFTLAELDKQLAAISIFMEHNSQALKIKNERGDTLIHLIVKKNNEPLLQELLKKYKNDIDLGIKNKEYETPINLARKLGYTNLERILLSA